MPDSQKTKRSFLRQQGTLNPHPEAVRHNTFRDNDFFDPQDMVQGKVRDAPASGGRQAARQPDCKDVWPLTAVVLSGTSRLPGNWSCRTVAAQTRATIRAQADERTDAVCGAASGSRTGNSQSSTGGTNHTAFRHIDSPRAASTVSYGIKKNFGERSTSCDSFHRSPAGWGLRRTAVASSTRMATGTRPYAHDHPRFPRVDGSVQPVAY